MNTSLFRLNWANVLDALLTAAATAVIVALVSLVTTPGFDVFAANWVLIAKNMANLGFIALVISLGKNLLSTSTGSLLGVGPTSVSSNA